MTRKKPSIKDVAALAGVSTATVSNVFSRKKPVNGKLRARVEKAAKQLGYEVDRAASQLRSGRGRVVVVLVPDLDDAFFTSLVSRLEVMAREHQYEVIVASSRDDRDLEETRLRALLAWRPAGIVAVPCSDNIPKILVDEQDRLPMVFADRVIPDGAIADTVTIDNSDAGAIAARYLVEMGHRNVAIAASHLNIAPIRERVRGASDLISHNGGEPTVLELGSNAERGAEIFSHWLERNPLPSAVIALTNVTTLGVLTALASHRVDIPEEVSIVAFDDYAWMSARRTALTAVRQPIDKMAQVVWERLLARMGGDRATPQPIILNASLQVRASTRRLSDVAPATGETTRKEKTKEHIARGTADRGAGRPGRIH